MPGRPVLSPQLPRAKVWAVLKARRCVDPQTGCWNWTGGVNSRKDPLGDYGRLSLTDQAGRRQSYYVHRLALWCVRRLELRSKRQGNHKCDNRRCFNPRHLQPGTQRDNVQQMLARKAREAAAWQRARMRGDDAPYEAAC